MSRSLWRICFCVLAAVLATPAGAQARGVKWWTWDDDVRRRLIGEMDNKPSGLVP